ncbi:hypothetical protein Baya_10798 [Bagarius yarrelli]|uniref:Uncharacterized protein n=1 Tax=Bagarius yarrelli TaxID=175774 RepID=A0A556UZD0_BAGYA|nr:hypothetical protein Baya_10798 [Bagarius yarrelli]
MATQKRPLRKLLCPLLPPGHDVRAGSLHLRNGLRIKPLQAFPRVGELPAVADKRERMVTTTEVAFGPKPYSRTEPKKMLKCSLTLEGDQSYITTNQEAYRGPALHGETLTMRKGPVRRERTPTTHYQTHYQQSFARPQCIYGRRLQALPQPDNLAINPALRQEYLINIPNSLTAG